tara:strand:- start:2435 stop:2671 length:237 start_codon:yes stop_codon:yes gene_type:complete
LDAAYRVASIRGVKASVEKATGVEHGHVIHDGDSEAMHTKVFAWLAKKRVASIASIASPVAGKRVASIASITSSQLRR